MVAPDNSFWFYVELTLLSKEDGTSTQVFKLTNRPFIDHEAGDYFWPLLIDVNGIGIRLGEYLPQSVQGSIVIDNSPNSLGYQRRFSDWLERYTLIDQVVNIYIDSDTQDDFTADNFALAWSSKVINYRMDFTDQRQILTLSIASDTIPRRVVTKVIDSVQFPYAPDSSLGQHLPIVFGGNIEVKPLMITAEGDTSPEWAYATTLADEFVVGGVQTYYAKDHTGEYVPVQSAGGTTTAVYSHNAGTTTQGQQTHATYEKAEIFSTSTSTYVCTSVIVTTYHASSGEKAGEIQVKIYDQNQTASDMPGTEELGASNQRPPGQVVAQGAASLDLYTSSGANSVHIALDKPLILSPSSNYFISFFHNRFGATENDVYWASPATNNEMVFFNVPGTYQGWSGSEFSDEFVWGIYGAVLSDDTTPTAGQTTADGLGHAQFEATIRSMAANQEAPNFSEIDWVLEIQGLKDTSGGGVTGSASALITSPQYATELLTWEYNGSAWVAGRMNTTEFSATHAEVNSGSGRYHRALAGKTEGQTFLDQLLSDILRNTACRMTVFADSFTENLAFWAWGDNTAATTVIDDESARVLQVNQFGSETIINRVQMYYARRIIPVDFVTGSDQGQFKAYAATLDWDSTTSALTTEYSEVSEAVYGKRYLNQSTFDWLGDTTSAEHVAEYYLASFAHPKVQVVLEVPWAKYSSLALLDVIEIVHPDLPSFYGTASQGNFPVYSWTQVHITRDYYLKRATRYRALIEGLELNLNNKLYPTIKLTCKLLLNYGKDPT